MNNNRYKDPETRKKVSFNKIISLKDFIEDHLKGTVVMNKDYSEVLIDEEYNTEDTFAFLVPPYQGDKYQNMYEEEFFDFSRLIDTLGRYRGLFIMDEPTCCLEDLVFFH